MIEPLLPPPEPWDFLFPELLGATKTVTGVVAIENFGAHATAYNPFHLLQRARRLCLALDVVR
ncbi:MAG: hypothetical protein ACHBNF_23060 [Chromatiales bacterium]